LKRIPGAETDYAEILEEKTLLPLKQLAPGVKARALVAVRLGGVRLIDNLSVTIS
jgi:pantothenate synthetase